METELDETCKVCGVQTSLACSYHEGGLCANCKCPQCKVVDYDALGERLKQDDEARAFNHKAAIALRELFRDYHVSVGKEYLSHDEGFWQAYTKMVRALGH
jgi:hypothetical protein